MKRFEVEEKSKGIIEKYGFMLDAMNKSVAKDLISDSSAIYELGYLKVVEISDFWKTQEKPFWMALTDVFVALHAVSVPVSLVFSSDGTKLNVYIGGHVSMVECIKNIFAGVLPQVKYEMNTDNHEIIYSGKNILMRSIYSNGGFIKGNPTGEENFLFFNPLGKIIRGMTGKSWAISIFATPLMKADSIKKQSFWLAEATSCSEIIDVSYTDSDSTETVTNKKCFYQSEQYRKKIEAFCEKQKESLEVGEWIASVNFASDSPENAKLLGGLMTSAFYGESSVPEPIHTIFQKNGTYKPLVNPIMYLHNFYSGYPHPTYGTFLSSRELAVLSSLPTEDTAGFTVKNCINFDVNRTTEGDTVIGNILENGMRTNNMYSIDLNALNRHCLVIGLTGSGKTNTIKSLVCSAGRDATVKRPFMIIEPAKKEYWELYKLGFDNLKIYSVGSNEKGSRRLCINPFEKVAYTDRFGDKKGVSIQTHIDFVYAAFKASFIMYTPMPYVLEKAIYSIYEDCGWDIDNNINTLGEDRYPTIEDLYFKIPKVVIEMGYDTKMQRDLIGSLQARINSLRIGSKGSALNVSRSFPMEHLLSGNTIIEIEDIGDDDVKAFIISLLLINVLEYRRQQEDCQQELRHLLFIEEAHRLLKNVQSGTGENADPRGAAVEFFCNMLAEMRSKGQGFVVADQIPSKLAPDLIKNTNLKIVHRTVSKEERELMGGATNMTEEQIKALSVLKQGVAAVYSEGDNRPKLVNPRCANSFMVRERASLTRAEVLRLTECNCMNADGNKNYESLTDTRSVICRSCNRFCQENPLDVISGAVRADDFYRFARAKNPLLSGSCKVKDLEQSISDFLRKIMDPGSYDNITAPRCIMAALIDEWNLEEHDKNLKAKIERIYINSWKSNIE